MHRKFITLLLPSLLTGGAQAAVVLAVDFGITAGANTETGFQEFIVPNAINGNVSATFGPYTVDIPMGTQAHNPSGVAGRDRANPLDDGGAFTNGDLMRDLITRFESGGNGQAPLTSFTISGLSPNAPYQFQVFSLDYPNNNGSQSDWYDMVPGVPVLIGSIINLTNTIPASNDDFSATGTVLADAGGVVRIGSTFTAGAGQLNGFILSDAIPEPGTAVLAGVALLGLARRRR